MTPFREGIKLTRPISKPSHHKSLGEALKSPCNVYLLDTNSRMRSSNEANAMNMGLSSIKNAIGKSVHDLCVKRECADAVIANDQEVLRNDTKKIAEEVAFYSNGRIHPFLSIKMPWYNEEDKIIGIFGYSIMFGMQPMAQSLAAILETGLLNQIKPMAQRFDCLFTLKEQDIIHHLIRGKTAREIGEALHLSRRTIEHYIENIKEKMDVKTKSQLIEKAISILNL